MVYTTELSYHIIQNKNITLDYNNGEIFFDDHGTVTRIQLLRHF